MPLLPAENVSIAVRASADSTAISEAIPAIAGGTAAGIVLAVAAVMAWKWWALIVRHSKKHQSSGRNVLRRGSQAKSNDQPRGPSMVFCSAESSDCTKDLNDSPPNTTLPLHPATPHRPSIMPPPPAALSGPPIKPPRNPARTLRRPSKENTARTIRSSFARASNRLSFRASTISSASVYSTESEEQRQARVPAAVIVAALGHTFGTRYLPLPNHNSEPYYTIGEEEAGSAIPFQRLRQPAHSNAVDRLHRVSNISDGSLGLQQCSQSIAPVGVAYGGDENERSHHEEELATATGQFDSLEVH